MTWEEYVALMGEEFCRTNKSFDVSYRRYDKQMYYALVNYDDGRIRDNKVILATHDKLLELARNGQMARMSVQHTSKGDRLRCHGFKLDDIDTYGLRPKKVYELISCIYNNYGGRSGYAVHNLKTGEVKALDLRIVFDYVEAGEVKNARINGKRIVGYNCDLKELPAVDWNGNPVEVQPLITKSALQDLDHAYKNYIKFRKEMVSHLKSTKAFNDLGIVGSTEALRATQTSGINEKGEGITKYVSTSGEHAVEIRYSNSNYAILFIANGNAVRREQLEHYHDKMYDSTELWCDIYEWLCR